MSTNAEKAHEIIDNNHKEALARSREQGAAMQLFLLAVNGSSLAAAFSLAGAFSDEPEFLSVLVLPSASFVVGLILVGVQYVISLVSQGRKMKLAQNLEEQTLKKKTNEDLDEEYIDEIRRRFSDLNKKTKCSAIFAQILQGFSLLAFLFGAGFGVCSIHGYAAPTAKFAGMVSNVVDGATFDVAGTRVRLKGIDPPERNSLMGIKAMAHLRRLVEGRYVECEDTGKKSFGRVVAVCQFEGGDIENAMKKAGYVRN